MNAIPDDAPGKIPEDFEDAYAGLVELVGRISEGRIPQELLGEKVDEWKHADCRGAATLGEAAIKALQYELASRGLKEPGSVDRAFGALGRVESALLPQPEHRVAERADGNAEDHDETPSVETPIVEAPIVESALPEAFREGHPQARGFTMGELQIIFERHEGPPHGHLSVSHPRRYPTHDEILRAARAPGGPPPNLWALVPKSETPTSVGARKTVHLYVLPPEDMLG